MVVPLKIVEVEGLCFCPLSLFRYDFVDALFLLYSIMTMKSPPLEFYFMKLFVISREITWPVGSNPASYQLSAVRAAFSFLSR